MSGSPTELSAATTYMTGAAVTATPASKMSPAFDSATLAGKTALVTGASRGIGAAVASRLAAANAHLALNYHTPTNPEFGRDNAADAQNVADAITAAGGGRRSRSRLTSPAPTRYGP